MTTTTTIAKERPILFSGRLVRAILEGRKSQTRRVVMSKARNMQESGQVCVRRNPDNDPWYREHVWSVRQSGGVWGDFTHEQMLAQCPYGKPGDRLWVREAWRFGYPTGEPGHFSILAPTGHSLDREGRCFYRSDFAEKPGEPRMLWRPSIHMPRRFSRIMLEVVGIRVERLQDITEEDAKAEGVQIPVHVDETCPPGKGYGMVNLLAPYLKTHKSAGQDALFRAEFSFLWDTINAGRGFGWAANPWVWVVDFRRVQT